MSVVDHALVRVQESDDQEGFCITIEAIDNNESWIQLKCLDLNFSYPFTEEPTETLSELGILVPPDVELSEWEANTYVTFQHSFDDLESTSEFVRQYMAVALQLADDEKALRVRAEFL